MIFTSITFFIFFTIVLVLMVLIRSAKGRIWMLLVASYIFYGNWNANYVLLIFMYGLWGWGLGLAMYNATTPARKKFYFWLSVTLSLGTLAFFKYANFIGENFAQLFDMSKWQQVDVVLPVGISFFTFHTMSYLIDLYRGKIGPSRDPIKFFLFVSFFPQLVAGPILRASSFLPQLDRTLRITWPTFVSGTQLFIGVAIQKSLVADHLSIFVDQVFRSPEIYSAGTLWLAVAAYSMQIFCDFAGYSLMAIGAARILGFELPENFRMPYLARSVSDFWHRWHISLSSWLREYLYIPLGGNRGTTLSTYRNLMITMVLGGLWHGAAAHYVWWGAYQGGLLAVERWFRGRGGAKADPIGAAGAFRLIQGFATFHLVCLGWILFRAEPGQPLGTMALRFINPAGWLAMPWAHLGPVLLTIAPLLILDLARRWSKRDLAILALPWPVRGGLYAALAYAFILLGQFESDAFIYFRF